MMGLSVQQVYVFFGWTVLCAACFFSYGSDC